MRFSNGFKRIFPRAAACAVCLAVLIIQPSCSGLLDDEETYDGSSNESSSVIVSTETHESGKGRAETEPDSGFDRISKAYIHNAWYDVEKDNPVDYNSIDSNDAYALKCVFYFNEPVSGNFKAILKRDGQQVAVKDIRIDGIVIVECDFSAGLEGYGNFGPGSYCVELETEGKSVAVSGEMRVN